MLTLTLALPTSAKGDTVGLTGVYDDDTDNDLTYLNGTGYISLNSTENEIFEWAQTCEYGTYCSLAMQLFVLINNECISAQDGLCQTYAY